MQKYSSGVGLGTETCMKVTLIQTWSLNCLLGW